MHSIEQPFRDREDAGRQLAEKLKDYRLPQDTVVLGLPRGGVVVAYQVADLLDFPLDVFMVRKLGVPGHEELAMGAIAVGEVMFLDQETVRTLNISQGQVDDVIEKERNELARREQLYRGDRPPLDVRNRTVIVVDDGLATGSTMLAAVTVLRQQQPRQLMVAVPVAAQESYAEFKAHIDDILCLFTPEPFYSVGMWYQFFSQTSDEEVQDLLQKAHQLF